MRVHIRTILMGQRRCKFFHVGGLSVWKTSSYLPTSSEVTPQLHCLTQESKISIGLIRKANTPVSSHLMSDKSVSSPIVMRASSCGWQYLCDEVGPGATRMSSKGNRAGLEAAYMASGGSTAVMVIGRGSEAAWQVTKQDCPCHLPLAPVEQDSPLLFPPSQAEQVPSPLRPPTQAMQVPLLRCPASQAEQVLDVDVA